VAGHRRRFNELLGLSEVMRLTVPDYKLILVGDATMSPYEITQPGGSGRALECGTGQRVAAALDQALSQIRLDQPAKPASRAGGIPPSIEMTRGNLGGEMYPLHLGGAGRCDWRAELTRRAGRGRRPAELTPRAGGAGATQS